ncbi:hypothetical protein F5Y05DRAFT_397675 [Hypoxylon sp. FL0543]|nr:hypothetical protein F5Y05DRAFT_397675 [Hypoxylon sp. FL0543]
MQGHPGSSYTPGLLQAVSRSVQKAAEEIFFSCNRFIIPAGPLFDPPDLFSARLVTMIKDISFAFDMRDECIQGLQCRDSVVSQIEFSKCNSKSKQRLLNNRDGALLKIIHDRRTKSIEDVWRRRINHQSYAKLERLQLDFDNCHCPIGCCRLTEFVCKCLSQKSFKHIPKVVEIMGWKDAGELVMITTCLRMAGIEAGSIKFIPPTVKQVNDEEDSS